MDFEWKAGCLIFVVILVIIASVILGAIKAFPIQDLAVYNLAGGVILMMMSVIKTRPAKRNILDTVFVHLGVGGVFISAVSLCWIASIVWGDAQGNILWYIASLLCYVTGVGSVAILVINVWKRLMEWAK